ncbi:MAG: four helix bundle protein [bacterium]
MAKSFYALKIWQKGYEILMKIYEITSTYPVEERYALVIDTRRSANSIIANIAESHGRYYFADKIRVLYTARGELEETRSHLKVACGRKYISEEKFKEIDEEYEGLSKGISGYIQNIESQKSNE